MVDTINPDTNQQDRFFGGFDKPDETKINLADGQLAPAAETVPPVAPQPQPVAPQPAPQPYTQGPVHDVSPAAPAEVKHTSYVNTTDRVNWRGVLVIAVIGLLATILVGAGIYFGVSALNSSKLKDQQTRLDSIQSELTTLRETPKSLELPASATPAVTTPVVTPVTTPKETPVTAPSTTVSPKGTDDSALGTG